MRAPYHYGAYLLNGLLAPPSGPDLAFTEELLGAYAWMCLVLVAITALLRRASRFAVLIIAPLLLTTGAWALMTDPASVVESPVPAGIPAAGLRASLMDIYWPSVELPWDTRFSSLPNVWKPAFALSYALTFVVLMRAAHAGRRSWPAALTLAALIGFLGLTSTSLAPIVFVLWAGLEAAHLIKSRRAGSPPRGDLIRSATGPALAALLLLAGGFSSLVLGDSTTSGMSLGTSEFFGGWRLLGTLDRLPGGVAVLGLGPLAVAGGAVLLARRDRLVLALAAGTVILLLVTLLFTYEPQKWDLVRLEGHARNFALFALLISLGVRLTGLRTARWRYAAGAVVVALVTWPTAVTPVRNLGLAVGHGAEIANAQPIQTAPSTHRERRFPFEHLPSDRIADYVRNHTAIDAPVFSPHPRSMTFATGRPNASGFPRLVHLKPYEGPEYRDAFTYFEPAAIRRLGFEYVHAPDAWVEGLPDEAVSRLDDPNLFELVVRDGSESLYRVLPAFLALDPPPAPASYEALRQAVPASAAAYLPASFGSLDALRVAAVLSHARLLGVISPRTLHLHTPWHTEPLGDRMPDLVITPAQVRALDVSARLAPADLVERRDRRLRARGDRRSGHAAAAASRAVSVQRPRLGPARRGRTSRLHRDLRRPRPRPVVGPGLDNDRHRSSTVGPADTTPPRRRHSGGPPLVLRSDRVRCGNDLPFLRVRFPEARPGISRQWRRVDSRPGVGGGIRPGPLHAGVTSAA